MTKVAFNISMSLDGFITAGSQTREEPLGKNGEFLHGWFFNGGAEGDAYVQRLTSNVGAVICGRKRLDPILGRERADGAVKAAAFRRHPPAVTRLAQHWNLSRGWFNSRRGEAGEVGGRRQGCEPHGWSRRLSPSTGRRACRRNRVAYRAGALWCWDSAVRHDAQSDHA